MEIDIFSREIAFGLTPFETVYIEDRKPHLLEQHFKRLKRACDVFRMEFRFAYGSFEEEVKDFLDAHHFDYGVLKIAVNGGRLLCNTRSPSYSREAYERGFRIHIARAVRSKANILNYFKTFNYGQNNIEDSRVKNKGFDTCLFMNESGNICETAYANIFFRKGSVLYTPKLSNGILNGIMRQEVINYARRNFPGVVKGQFGAEEIPGFEECFITNSVAGVFPVDAIDDYRFPDRSFTASISKEAGFIRPWNIKSETCGQRSI